MPVRNKSHKPDEAPVALAVKLRRCGRMLDTTYNSVRGLIDRGCLVSFMDRGIRKVTVASINKYLADCIAAEHGEPGPRAEAAARARTHIRSKRRLTTEASA